MIAHLRALSLIQIFRFAVGLAIGIFLIWRSGHIPVERLSRLEPHDQTLFLVVGWLLVAFALVRGNQALMVLLSIHASSQGRGYGRSKGRAFLRRLGLALAVVDLIDLTAFPITTGCGAYGLLIYRHPDIRDFFEGVFSSREAIKPSRKDQNKSLRNPAIREKKNPSLPVPGFLDS